MKFTAACIQVNSSNDMDANIKSASNLITKAAKNGADFITTPENVAFMSASPGELLLSAYSQHEHPAIIEFSKLARNLQKTILIGSLAIKETGQKKLANRSFIIDGNGEIVATYDKIHLFDSSIAGGETHKESDRFFAGNKPVIATTKFGKIGMTICYDVRFPYLYSALAKQGAGIMTVPAAFTHFTGEAHWHVLLRARAIETGSYIIAPAQTGTHPSGRKTFGHSLIIDPWGKILTECEEGVGIIAAEIDIDKIQSTRMQMPSLEHYKAL